MARRNGGLARRRGSGGARQLARARGATSLGRAAGAAGNRIGARRRRRQGEAAEGEGFGSAGRWEGQGGERDRDAEESGEREEEEREEEEAVEGGEWSFLPFFCVYYIFIYFSVINGVLLQSEERKSRFLLIKFKFDQICTFSISK